MPDSSHSSAHSFFNFLESNPLAAWCFEKKSKKICYANKTAVAWYGYTLKEYQDRSIHELVMSKDIFDFKGGETEKKLSILLRNNKKVKARVWVRKIMLDRKSYGVVYADKIPAVKKKRIAETKEYLQQANERLSDTLNFARMGSAELNLKTLELLPSPELLSILEVNDSPAKIPVSYFIETYIAKEDQHIIYDKISEGLHNGHTVRKEVGVEFHAITATGKRRLMEARGVFRPDSALGIIHDITEEKQIEREYIRKSRQIENILNSITEGFFAVDNNWCFILANTIFEKMAGYEKGALLGKNIWDTFPMIIDSPLGAMYKESFASGESKQFEFQSKVNPNITFEVNTYPNSDGLLVYFRDITKKKQADEEVRRLAMVANHTSNSVIVIDKEGFITWVNKGFEQLTGYSLHEVLGRRPESFLAGPDTCKQTLDLIQHALSNKQGFKVEMLNYTKHNQPIWLDVEMLPIKSADGDVTGYITIEMDITQLKMAVSEMIKSQEELQTIVNNIPVDVFIKDLKGRYTFYNKAFERHFHESFKPYPGFTDFDVFPEADACSSMESDEEVITKKETLKIEHELEDAASTDTYYTIKFPLYNIDQQVYGVGGISLQITDRKKMEMKLRESEARYRSIVDDQIEMICRFNKDGTITYANRSMRETFNMGDVLPIRISDFLPPAQCAEVAAHIKQFFNDDLSQLPLQRKVQVKGEYRWHEWFAVPLKDEHGNIYEVQSIGHDITDRKRLEFEQARLDKIVRESYNEIFIFNTTTLALEFGNASVLNNLGYSHAEFKELYISDLFTFPDEMALQALLNSLKNAETDRLQLQLRLKRKDESYYNVEVLIQILEKDQSFVAIASDITSKLITEKKLLDTIVEKEILIKEIHHRVKNNLQLISSLLYLKMISLEQTEIRGFLENIRQKIRSISLIHERLLQSEILDKVEISDYLGKLIKDIQVTYFRQDLDVKIETCIEENTVSLDAAIVCGLIVNEIVTNGLKHAFTGRSNGLIQVSLHNHKKPLLYTLTITDNGVTLPAHISPGTDKSFGMQLIDVFVKQLNGTLQIIRDNGTTFQITF